ncbi:hypothetical protein [Micromonospora sp. LOL_024]|uniref:hypothetical protein n=1 Tax=Micromonospora sp. LOL_024 TaxID=3345412 RepID=UPI003A8384C0
MGVRVEPITEARVRAAGEFLHAHHNGRVAVQAWVRAAEVPWQVDAPNHGMLLRADDGQVVGALLAFYSERMVAGRTERLCNLGAWCVLPEFRFHSLKLLRALLAQPGYHFTDLSPSGNVVPINERHGFRFLDTTTTLTPNLPWPSLPGRRRVSADPEVIRRTLTGPELARYLDHARAPAARHIVLVDGDEWCYVVFRRDRRKRLPLFASILHVSNRALFRRMHRMLLRHLLVRHGALATLAELRLVGDRPPLSVRLPDTRRKMFRSDSLDPDDVDYLYSELVCLSW